MNDENKDEGFIGTPKTTRPETPSLDTPATDVAPSAVENNISERLGSNEKSATTESTDAPKASKPNIVDLNNMTTGQIQDLQELFATTPRRAKEKDVYHTIELREIGGKIIVEWGQSYFDLKRDVALRQDVMKTMIPVHFAGDVDAEGKKKFVDILWSDDFMTAEKVTCRILKMDKEDNAEVVGTTLKRGKDGEQTLQEVEMYVNRVVITLTVQLPNGKEVVMDGRFAN